MSHAPAVIFTGGGTGGHVFPLLAVARAVQRLAEVECVFVGTDRGLETRVVPEAGFRLEVMPILPLRGRGLVGASRGAMSVLKTLPRCRELLRELSPRAVFSLGGYAAAPMALAARALGVPLALMEPNSVPGLANRAMGPAATRVYLAFRQAERYFPGARVRAFGVALRDGFSRVPLSEELSGARPVRLLVLGGSQGARVLNERVPRALSQVGLPLAVHHQVGRGNQGAVEQLYRELLVSDVRVSEFIQDMPRALAEADLVVSRAGASAIAEICAVGRPSVLVPLATSAGDHQRHNALELERVGAAVCLSPGEDTVARVASTLRELAVDRGCLRRMAEAAASWGRPDAAQAVARDLLQLGGVSATRPAQGREQDDV